jgi:hypothetical protein
VARDRSVIPTWSHKEDRDEEVGGRWIVTAVVVALVGVAAAQMGWGYGPGMMGPGMMGQGWQGGGYPCGGMGWYGQGQAPTVQSPDNAKQIAQQYADQYLKGFTVDKVLPFSGMGGMAMYSVELKGPNNELRTLHVNPWGQVMPFGGPWHRG